VEKPPGAIENIHPAPEGRQTEAGLSPLRGSRIYLYSLPVVTLRSTTG